QAQAQAQAQGQRPAAGQQPAGQQPNRAPEGRGTEQLPPTQGARPEQVLVEARGGGEGDDLQRTRRGWNTRRP
ncbi:MAG: hypothetical protein M3P96_13855, partial [Actinomycetota bacterium]|nr:hypothetical protein [Actinomycetota bacterium]